VKRFASLVLLFVVGASACSRLAADVREWRPTDHDKAQEDDGIDRVGEAASDGGARPRRGPVR
jgi:hypothetical protein